MKNPNSHIIGHIFDKTALVNWEVWSDGTAYGDQQDSPVLYRSMGGAWCANLIYRRDALPDSSSKLLEQIYSAYLSGIIAPTLLQVKSR